MAKHRVEMAKSKVLIEDGRVQVLSDPKIRRCPLRAHLYGCESEDRGTVKRVLEGHVKELGMYTSKRVLELDDDPVTFGASEMINDAISEGMVDAAVTVCEGVGTVIITRPEVLQAVGAHMTGIIETEPIPAIKERLTARGSTTLDDRCGIDQVKGFELAVQQGHRDVVVTIVGTRPDDAKGLREAGERLGRQPIIFAVHTSGISKRAARILAQHCDIVWGCASKAVREVIGPLAEIQIGTGIPVFALTDIGKRIVLNRALHIGEPLLVQRAKLPSLAQDKQPEPLL